MGFLSSIKAYIIGAAVLLGGVLAAVARHFYRQTQKQRRAKERTQRELKAVQKKAEQRLELQNAQQRAERRKRENERAEKKRIDNDIRPDSWGDRRLPKKD